MVEGFNAVQLSINCPLFEHTLVRSFAHQVHGYNSDTDRSGLPAAVTLQLEAVLAVGLGSSTRCIYILPTANNKSLVRLEGTKVATGGAGPSMLEA